MEVAPDLEGRLYVGGEWQPAASRAELEVDDPATGTVIASVADGGPADITAAIDACCSAQEAWAGLAPAERGELLRRAYELTLTRAEQLSTLISLETGKPSEEARAEVVYAADFLRWYAAEASRVNGRFGGAPQGGSRILTVPQPVGPCLLVCPWNFPLAMATRKVGPALAAGCTFVLKPAHQTPLVNLAFAGVLEEVGLPAGVGNVVVTSDAEAAVAAALADGRIRKLSFTGSTAVGRHLLHRCADGVLRSSMELGGNAPLIVFEDCDIEHAVEQASVAKLRNAGQSCVAANRLYVHDSIAEEFVSALAERFRATSPSPAPSGGGIGPLIDRPAQARIDSLVKRAVSAGAVVHAGGSLPSSDGYFYPPTVLTGIADGSELIRGEIFGPVAPVHTFSSEQEAIRFANEIDMGLASYIFTSDLERALRVSERLDTGIVGVNRGVVSNAAAPFGGVKQSGLGREGASEGIAEYQELKYIAIDGSAHPPDRAAHG